LDSDLHKKRIESRIRNIHGIPEITWEDVGKSRREYVPWEEKRLVLDTASTIKNNLDKALDFIGSKKY
jgi:hypothetical protein